MSAWIGPLGGLVEILHYRGSLSVSHERAQSTRTTLGGRVKVQRGPRARREWKASMPYASADVAASFLALVDAGDPPWAWVDPYAQVTNLLTPGQSTLEPGAWAGGDAVPGGAVQVGNAYAPRSMAHPDGANILLGSSNDPSRWLPVAPGIPVSASMQVRGAGTFGILWRDWQGDPVSSTSTAYDHPSMARVSLTGLIPPAGATSARVWLNGLRQAAFPCFTWTRDAPVWSIGRGCPQSIVEDVSESPQQADSGDPSRRYSTLNFTVREVG